MPIQAMLSIVNSAAAKPIFTLMVSEAFGRRAGKLLGEFSRR